MAQCTFSPKINESSKRLAHSARRPATARGRPATKDSSQVASKVSFISIMHWQGGEESNFNMGMVVISFAAGIGRPSACAAHHHHTPAMCCSCLIPTGLLKWHGCTRGDMRTLTTSLQSQLLLWCLRALHKNTSSA